MDDSMVYPGENALLDMPFWKTAVSTLCAVALALFFASAGVWKIVDPLDWSARVAQLKVPGGISLPLAIGLGVVETFAAALLVVPRFRRWGAWLTAGLLVTFMAWIGFHYQALTGADCSCFPWLKRSIGPGFFISDAAMLGAAAIAGVFARPSFHPRGAAVVLAAIAVFAGASYGVAAARQTGIEAPPSITVDGQPYSLREGKVFLYFFDPECSHCFKAAQAMSKMTWNDTKLVAIPTRVPQFAQGFLDQTGLRARLSSDVELLKKTFPHGDPPYGVAIQNGRQTRAFAIFDAGEPETWLRQLGYIQ